MPATSFVALYRGESIAAAHLVAVSADPALVSQVTVRLLEAAPGGDDDPAVRKLERGRRSALRLICREAADARR